MNLGLNARVIPPTSSTIKLPVTKFKADHIILDELVGNISTDSWKLPTC